MGRYIHGSDHHLNHPYLAKLRGFTRIIEGPDGEPVTGGDTDAHDEVIIENHNKIVRKDDIMFFSGDFAMNWKGVSEKLARMNGRKILIPGNHDIMWAGFSDGWKYVPRWIGPDRFESIAGGGITRPLGKGKERRQFMVSHFPYTGDHVGDEDRAVQYRLRDEGQWLVHGHTHARVIYDAAVHPRQLHVGMDATGMKPVLEADLIEMMRSLDPGSPES